MANSAQAKKRARQAEERRRQNASQRSRMRTEIKKIVSAIQGGGKEAAQATYRSSVQVIDSMVNKGIVHKNKAARHKSRLNAHIREL